VLLIEPVKPALPACGLQGSVGHSILYTQPKRSNSPESNPSWSSITNTLPVTLHHSACSHLFITRRGRTPRVERVRTTEIVPIGSLFESAVKRQGLGRVGRSRGIHIHSLRSDDGASLHQQSDIEYARLNELQPSLLSLCVTEEGIAYWDKMQCDDYDGITHIATACDECAYQLCF
jgi:hypothetical protein